MEECPKKERISELEWFTGEGYGIKGNAEDVEETQEGKN